MSVRDFDPVTSIDIDEDVPRVFDLDIHRGAEERTVARGFDPQAGTGRIVLNLLYVLVGFLLHLPLMALRWVGGRIAGRNRA